MENKELIINKIIETIKTGKPPVNCESINLLTIKTRNFNNNFNKILLKINSSRQGNYEIITFVGQRGYGKTHLLNYLKCYESYLENINILNKGKAPVIVYHPTFLDSDLSLFHQTINNIGKENLISYINKNFPNLKDEEIFNLFIKNNLDPVISSLFVGLINNKRDISNKCYLALTGNYDLSQTPIKLKFITLNKNICEDNVFSYFKTLTYLVTKYEEKSLIIEFDELQEYLKEQEHNIKRVEKLARRIHKYINENIKNCIIIFSFTNDAYEMLINNEYSDKLGLKNKIENTKLDFKPLDSDERLNLVNKLFDLFENSVYMKDLDNRIPDEKKKEIIHNLENQQPENPRAVIKLIINDLMKFWEENYLIKKILDEMSIKGEKLYNKYKESKKILGDMFHKSLFEFFNSIPKFKPVEKEV